MQLMLGRKMSFLSLSLHPFQLILWWVADEGNLCHLVRADPI